MQQLRICRYLFLLLTLCATQSLQAADDAAAWLERMIQAAHQLNYSGTFVYQQGDSLQSMKIIHAVSEHGESERMVSLTGPNREVIRNREKVTCYLPENSSIVVEAASSTPRSFPLHLPSDLGQLRAHYDISLGGEERIAGLLARKVVIAPADRYRYGQNFWVAKDSGLLLRAEIINETGAVVEQLMFTSLQMHDSIPEELLLPEFSNDATVLELERQPRREVLTSSQQPHWEVSSLPPGFSLKLQRNHYLPEKFEPVEHHVYTDGLASVSVFVEKRYDDDNPLNGPSAMGGVNAFGRVLDEHAITVVGEVPPLTVKQIAQSLQPRSGHD